jgi:hypothetical protein
MEVLLFSSDLMGQPKIGDAAKAIGMTFRVAANQAKLLELVSGESQFWLLDRTCMRLA